MTLPEARLYIDGKLRPAAGGGAVSSGATARRRTANGPPACADTTSAEPASSVIHSRALPMSLLSPDANFSNFIPFSTHVDTHVVKTREGDYLITWLLSGFPFVGREDWELEHRHKTFNNLFGYTRPGPSPIQPGPSALPIESP